MADKKGGPATDAIMSPAEMKPLLMMSKREAVYAAIGMTKNKDGVILLSKRTKPRHLLDQLKTDARKAKIELDPTSLRFGTAEVDTENDPGMVTFAVNKNPPAALRPKLLEVLKRAAYGKIDIGVDTAFEDVPEGEAGSADAPEGPDETLSGDDVDATVGSTIEGADPSALQEKFRTDIMLAAKTSVDRSRINCDRFSLCLRNAADDFSDYTAPILKEMETEEFPQGILGPLIEISLGIIGGHLGEKIGKEVSKLLGITVDKLTDPFKAAVSGGVEKAMESAATLDDVKDSIKQLIAVGKANAKAISQQAGETIEKSLTKIGIDAEAHNDLTPNQKTIIVCFLGVDPDEALEKFGVPSGASTAKIEGDIFAGWVKAFHKKLLQHQNEKNADSDYMEQISGEEIDRLAQRDADEARQQFVDGIGAAEKQKKESAE